VNPLINKSPWYRWPENPKTGRLPWFTILYRIIFFPLLLIGMSICFVAIFFMLGLHEAKDFWRSV